MKKEIIELEELIRHHKSKYYQGDPEISDVEYDALEEKLKSLDSKNPVLSIVGSATFSGKKVKHKTKMLSLNKTYKVEDLESWMGDEEVVSTLKVDGVSCSLVYEKGLLKLAKTRGDGSYGEDITEKVRWMRTVPTNLSEKKSGEIRGELYCTDDDFLKLSSLMKSRGLEEPTSKRNIVAGLVGRKENLDLNKKISFMAFDLISDEIKIKTELDKYKYLENKGFKTPNYKKHKEFKTIQKVLDEALSFMTDGEYLIDGIVFTFDKIALHEEMGETAHHPRYKLAFKYAGEAKETIIKDILWSVSRNGILTPIASIEDTELSGAVISRVTLHNFGMVETHQLKKGDRIKIIRSGEVIPKFLEVIKSSKNKFIIPKKCPSCAKKITIDEIRLRCLNSNCPAQKMESILNFVKKIGIEDISSKRLEEMINSGLVGNISDLYKLKEEDFLKLDKVKEKLAQKFHTSIQKSKSVGIIDFLAALGINGGAYNKCEKVVLAGFDTIDKIRSLSVEKMMEIEGFAEKSATEFLNSFNSKDKEIKKLEKEGFIFVAEKRTETEITGKKICITGSLTEKRSVIEDRIRKAGGLIVGSVSKNTNLLLTNETEAKSSKFKKALDLGIEIVSEENLLRKI